MKSSGQDAPESPAVSSGDGRVRYGAFPLQLPRPTPLPSIEGIRKRIERVGDLIAFLIHLDIRGSTLVIINFFSVLDLIEFW